jgi:hypothetical protein
VRNLDDEAPVRLDGQYISRVGADSLSHASGRRTDAPRSIG